MKNEVPGAITPMQPDGGDALALSTKVDDTLLQSLVWMAAYHGKPTSEASMLSGLPAGRFISPKQAQLAMEQSGFSVGRHRAPAARSLADAAAGRLVPQGSRRLRAD